MVMVDPNLSSLVKQSWELFHKEFAAFKESITSLEEQQQFLESNSQEHQQRLDGMSAKQTEQGTQIGALTQKQNDLEDNVEEQRQRLNDISAQQNEQARQHDENYSQMLEMFKSLREQSRQGTVYFARFPCRHVTSPSPLVRTESRVR